MPTTLIRIDVGSLEKVLQIMIARNRAVKLGLN